MFKYIAPSRQEKTLPSFEGAYRFCRQNQALQGECPSFTEKGPCSFETSVTIYQSTRRNDPENLTVNKTHTFHKIAKSDN